MDFILHNKRRRVDDATEKEIRRVYWKENWPRERILETFKISGAFLSKITGGSRRSKL